jgi:mRNA interferase RelE/StbE
VEYDVFILRRAQKELANLPKSEYTRVRDAIAELKSNPRPSGCKKLTGREGWRVRSGDYGIIYECDDRENRVTVLNIGHRKDIYS